MNTTDNKLNLKDISGSTLKIIAMITMMIDHIALVFLEPLVKSTGIKQLTFASCINSSNKYAILYILGRIVGRIAFPIFCFLLVQGFIYTKSKPKYAIRLFVFALISEIPYDLVNNNAIYSSKSQNVFFTLLLGLLGVCFAKSIKDLIIKENSIETIIIAMVIYIIVPLFMGLVAEIIKSEYGMYGVFAIGIINFINIFPELINKNIDYRIKNSIAMVLCCIVLIVFNSLELAAFITIPLVFLYNTKKGLDLKYIFYCIYPAHLLIFYLLK